jgi:alkaline phosphatase
MRIFNVSTLIFVLFSNPLLFAQTAPALETIPTCKNVILMIPDGCSFATQTLARYYAGKSLNLDSLTSGSVNTHSTNSLVTDSAAAGTAYATGFKTTSKFISIRPQDKGTLSREKTTSNPYAPLATVLEAARLQGKATGIVSTSAVCHATPATFSSHVSSRKDLDQIMMQLVYSDVTVVLGGGMNYMRPKSKKGQRSDNENLIETLSHRGYPLITTKTDLESFEGNNLWGLFAGNHMQPDMDRERFQPEEPTLAEMTAKAIEILSRSKNGFFLMVEGSQVDWGNHANDPKYALTEFLAFDKAVGIALDFAKKDQQTLIIACPDHNTGGMTIGKPDDEGEYGSLTYEMLLDPLKGMRVSATRLRDIITQKGIAIESITESVREYWGFDLSEAQAQEILDKSEHSTAFRNALGEVVSRDFTQIGWIAHGHEGSDIPLWSYLPDNRRINGALTNIDVNFCIRKALNLDMDMTQSLLYVLLDDLTTDWKYVEDKDGTHPRLLIGYNIELPIGKSIAIVNESSRELGSLILFNKETKTAYVPESLRQWIRLAN